MITSLIWSDPIALSLWPTRVMKYNFSNRSDLILAPSKTLIVWIMISWLVHLISNYRKISKWRTIINNLLSSRWLFLFDSCSFVCVLSCASNWGISKTSSSQNSPLGHQLIEKTNVGRRKVLFITKSQKIRRFVTFMLKFIRNIGSRFKMKVMAVAQPSVSKCWVPVMFGVFNHREVHLT